MVEPLDELRIERNDPACGSLLVIVHSVSSDTEVIAVYRQPSGKVIAEPFVVKDDRWQFKHEGPNGAYTHNTQIYNAAVSKLKSLLPESTKYFY